MKKIVISILGIFLFCLVHATTTIYDPSTVDSTGYAANGMSIVTINGTKYLKLVLKGWNTTVTLSNYLRIPSTDNRVTFEAKLNFGSSTAYTYSQVKLFVVGNDWTGYNGQGLVSNEFTSFVGSATRNARVNKVLISAQQTVSWDALTGDTLYIGKIITYNFPSKITDIIFNPATIDSAGYAAKGMSIVTIDNTKYLKTVLSNSIALDTSIVVSSGKTAFACEAKLYIAQNTSLTNSDINLNLSLEDVLGTKNIINSTSSSSFKKYYGNVTSDFEVAKINFAETRTSGDNLNGDTVYIGEIYSYTRPTVTDSVLFDPKKYTGTEGTVVTIDGTSYLKIVPNAWGTVLSVLRNDTSTIIPISDIYYSADLKVKKAADNALSYSDMNVMVKLFDPLGNNNLTLLKTSSSTINKYTGSATGGFEVGKIQVAIQDINTGNATNTDTLYLGRIYTHRKVYPSIYWNPSNMFNDEKLTTDQLNAYATTDGTFTYEPALGTTLSLGTNQILKTTFKPNDSINYLEISKTVPIDVVLRKYYTDIYNPETADTTGYAANGMSVVKIDGISYLKVILNSWSSYIPSLKPVAVPRRDTVFTFAAKLKLSASSKFSNSQINTFVQLFNSDYTSSYTSSSKSSSSFTRYTKAITPEFNVCSIQLAGFETVSYTATSNDTLYVSRIYSHSRIEPTITWNCPSYIMAGSKLSSEQLNATTTVPGTFVYTPALGTIMNNGTSFIKLTFTPSDTVNYMPVSKSLKIEAIDATSGNIIFDPANTDSTGYAANGMYIVTVKDKKYLKVVFKQNTATSLALNKPLIMSSEDSILKYNSFIKLKNDETLPVNGISNSIQLKSDNETLYTSIKTCSSTSVLNADTISIALPIYSLSFSMLKSLDNSILSGDTLYIGAIYCQKTPVVSWTPDSVFNQVGLDSTILNASTNINGTFYYTPSLGSLLSSGVKTLSLVFVPNDTISYSSIQKEINVTVYEKNSFAKSLDIIPNIQAYVVEWGDYDNDGLMDAFVGSTYGDNLFKVYHNNGDSTFTASSLGTFTNYTAHRALWADINNDEYLDLIISGTLPTWNAKNAAYYDAQTTKIAINNKNGTFSIIAGPTLDDNLSLTNDMFVCFDYDNDGDNDIITTTSVYINDSKGAFTLNSNVQLLSSKAISCKSLQFADYDNDGNIDILVAGYKPVGTKIYHNNGNSTFTLTSINVGNDSINSATWVDYNNDGLFDIAVQKWGDYGMELNVYYNNGDGTFTKYISISGGPIISSVGDFDNDGLADFIDKVGNIYKHNAGGSLSLHTSTSNYWETYPKWIDINNDGNLDFVSQNVIYWNKVQYGTGNTKPAIPQGLKTEIAANGSITLVWNKASDAETHANGLTYNVRIGTIPGGVDIMTSANNQISVAGNAQFRTFAYINNLKSNTYYWSVQTTDGSYNNSNWSEELSFTTKDKQTINFASLSEKTYGDVPFVISATSSKNLPVSYVSANHSIASIVNDTVIIKKAGTVKIYANQPGNDTVYAADTAYQTLVINKKILTISLENKSKIEGWPNPVFTFSYDGFVNGDNSSSLVTLPTASTTATNSSTSGNYAINGSGAESDNYSFSYTPGTLLITDVPIQICLISIDLNTKKNMVIWNKEEGYDIKGYNVYRESNVANVYTKIGYVPFANNNTFVDSTSYPEQKQYRYKISVLDSSNDESVLGKYHQPIFLQYVSSMNGVNLNWKTYQVEDGSLTFLSYIIYKGSDSANLVVVDTVSANADVYIDTDPNALSQFMYYRVAGIKNDACELTSKRKSGSTYSTSMSNLESNHYGETSVNQTTTEDIFCLIYPNPAKEFFTIKCAIEEPSPVCINIYDITGNLKVRKVYNKTEGVQSYNFSSKEFSLSRGVYFVKVQLINKTSIRKLVLE